MVKGLMSVLLVLVAVSSSFGKPEKNSSAKKEKKLPQTLSRGWGDELTWTQTYEEALFRARSSLKLQTNTLPQMVSMCPDSSLLCNKKSCYGFIADPSLTVRADITGRYGNRLYAYEPADLDLLISNMKKAKKLLKTEL
ncbi:Anterior gradient protein 2-like [Acipenser ruthenus]|uniref:Anterior gradient protein 2-like n=1 Tax=Acipenser ruthenus TaxID=7906 RepID=A0A662YVC9_ACIRT|nr:Anterior gradient protein 2-like [Acipenser ruthenus]